jgi:energy-coupling factor transport system permease protein
MKQPWAWVCWLVATIVVISITRNPLYLVLILMCVVFVGMTLRQAGAESASPFPLWKLAAWILILSTTFNALTSHYGQTVLFTIPGHLPLLSGPVTLEAIVYGFTNGLVLTAMLASFMVLNLALTVRELISLIPQAFFPMAVVTSIAVTYLPTTLRQFKQIREAQAIRGHQMRTLRDWLPLWMPLLVGGLEHAMQLAEAMTSRGFASAKPGLRQEGNTPRIFLIIGLVLLTLGWVVQLGGAGISGLTLIVLGSLMIVGGLWYLGRLSARTAYHSPGWGWQDWLTVLVSVGVLALCVLPIPGFSHATLYYDPYPVLTLPDFSPLLGMAILGLLLPGLLVHFRSTIESRGVKTHRSVSRGRPEV